MIYRQFVTNTPPDTIKRQINYNENPFCHGLPAGGPGLHKASLGSYAHKPVTNDHPDEAVMAGNWKTFASARSATKVPRDGEFVRVPLIVMDGARSGK